MVNKKPQMTNNLDTALECLRQINPAILSYEEWLAVGMALKDAGATATDWEAWSTADSRHKTGECQRKWAGFNGAAKVHPVGVGTLVKLCRDQGGSPPATDDGIGHELDWEDEIGPGIPTPRKAADVPPIVRQEWLQDEPLPPEPDNDWDGLADLQTYLRTLFQPDERVGIVTEAYESEPDKEGRTRWLPRKGFSDRTRDQILDALAKATDLGAVVGDWNESAGAWVRFNPLDGNGVSDSNVTAYRFALVESDELSIERQYAVYRKLELPIAALVHSGNKSLHAIVRIEAPDFPEYQRRVDMLYKVCKQNGLAIDRQNRNPSRLSRLPGATRGWKKGLPAHRQWTEEGRQWLVAVNIGQPSWSAWSDWLAAQNDTLPDPECLEAVWNNMPPLAPVLIDGLLRHGHKLLLTGPANAGKSLALLKLAIAIAEGGEWFGWQCTQGKVLYVNLEVDRASCFHRFRDVYEALGIEPKNIAKIDVWNLRGKALPLTELAPKLIRRALKGRFVAIIVDPIYKILTGDENSAHEMALFCNQFDRVCSELGASVIFCHHHSKGSQGGKDAADRASGSGVFKRDPDALLDMVELQIDDARRKQISNRCECDAMAAEFELLRPEWRSDCSEDDQKDATKLQAWAEAVGLGDAVRAARPRAIAEAARVTGWRVECGTAREFAKPESVRVWFRYPLHQIDQTGLLDDALADGEEPYKRNPKEAGQAKAERTIGETREAVEASRTDAGVTKFDDVVEFLGLNQRTVRYRLKNAGYTVEKGLVLDTEESI